jgi:hypothetical protein
MEDFMFEKWVLNRAWNMGIAMGLLISAGIHANAGHVQNRNQQLQPAPVLNPVTRLNGDIHYLNLSEADRYCKTREHSRLPTPQEFATALNPKGVSNTPRDGFHEVYKEDGSVDFYYNPSTYRRPSGDKVPGDEDDVWYWTLPLSTSVSPDAFTYASLFSGESGTLSDGSYLYFDYAAARCLARQR